MDAYLNKKVGGLFPSQIKITNLELKEIPVCATCLVQEKAMLHFCLYLNGVATYKAKMGCLMISYKEAVR